LFTWTLREWKMVLLSDHSKAATCLLFSRTTSACLSVETRCVVDWQARKQKLQIKVNILEVIKESDCGFT